MSKTTNEKVARGQTLRQETGPDRSDDKPNAETFNGREMKGGPTNITHSIKDGKVPRD